jgi:hypothetical protein
LNSGDDFDENAHDEKQRKIDRWMDVIDLSLSAVSDVQSGERFSGQLSQILEASMFDKLLWQTTAQTLIDVDPNEMRKVIPTLLARVAKDDVWIVGVVKIAEYARCAETREGREVFNLVLKSLRGLGRSNAKKLLLTCQYLADEYCQDFRITRDFYRARTLLSKALKSKKKQ